MTDEQKPSIFSDNSIAASLDKIDPPEKGGEVIVSLDKQGGVEVGVEASIVNNDKINWTAGGYWKRQWNGAMDWAGLTRLKG